VLLLVWSHVAAFNEVQESLRAAQICRSLRKVSQEPLLWRRHAFLLQYIKDVPQWSGLGMRMSAASFLQQVNWQLLVKLNAASRRGVLVRIGNFELRVPLYSFQDVLARLKVLYLVLRKILGNLSAAESWHFRLRWLQWGGRPGRLLDRRAADLLCGSRLFLEWADAESGWLLPPKIFHAGLHFSLGDSRSCCWPSLPLCQGYMVRVVSSLLPREHWLHLPVDSNLWNLMEQVSQVLRLEGVLATTPRPMHFRLADLQPFSVVDPEGRPDREHPLLWELAWAHCETIYAEEAARGTDAGAGDEVFVISLQREPFQRDACHSPGTENLEASSKGAQEPSHRETLEPMREVDNPRVGATAERIVPHFAPILIPGTQKCRQFEFHPLQSDVLLVGDKDGAAKIIQTGPERISCGPPTQVESSALLALSWLRHCPNVAVAGSASSGAIHFLRYFPDSSAGPALTSAATVGEKFPKLSSLSVNCSDNFLLASGISSSICVFDIETGMVLSRGAGVHEHFINISRFSNESPHMFATASFDHTCKIWDLRRPLRSQYAAKTLRTDGHNVMCTFSPDDRHFLCSGVDTRITQYEVATWKQSPPLLLRAPVHKERYRRSAYLANSRYIVTGSTEESHVHLLSVTGQKLGCVDFRGILQDGPKQRSRAELIRGTVVLDDADPCSGSRRNSHEYVQSIRAHPAIAQRVGVLMALPEGAESHLALVDVSEKEIK